MSLTVCRLPVECFAISGRGIRDNESPLISKGFRRFRHRMIKENGTAFVGQQKTMHPTPPVVSFYKKNNMVIRDNHIVGRV